MNQLGHGNVLAVIQTGFVCVLSNSMNIMKRVMADDLVLTH